MVPGILTLDWSPPDSPRDHPQERGRREMHRHPFGNQDCRSMRIVEQN
jgi:hypothetical protein